MKSALTLVLFVLMTILLVDKTFAQRKTPRGSILTQEGSAVTKRPHRSIKHHSAMRKARKAKKKTQVEDQGE